MPFLAPIGKLARLEVLSLYGWDLARHKLAELAGLASLRCLDLTARGVRDVSAPVALPRLEKVRVHGYELAKLKGHDALKGKLADGENGVADFDDALLGCDA